MTLRLLEQDISGLTDRVKRLSAAECARLVHAAVELALVVRPTDDARVRAALEALRAGAGHSVDDLERMIDQLDERSAELFGAWDEARDEEPGSEREQSLRRAHADASHDASALGALRAALSGDEDLATAGAVLYEAAFAMGYRTDAIEALLGAVEDGLTDPVKQAMRRLASGGANGTGLK